MDLDDELRRMFATSGDQLDVPVRADAEQTIVAGARRRRQRRVAAIGASGAAAFAVVVAVGIALAKPTPESMPPAIPTSTTSAPSETTFPTTPTTEPVPEAPPANPPTDEDPPDQTVAEPPSAPQARGEPIGPTGFRDLRLGMDYESALATGMIGAGEPPGESCAQYPLLIDGAQAGWVNITAARGIETIGPEVPVHAPSGLSVGWTTEQFLARYPDERERVEDSAITRVPVAGNQNAVYRVDGFRNGAIATITLQFIDQTCYE